MKQRVNLQYSIEIDELPTETRRLFLSVHKFLTDALNTISAVDESNNNLLTVESLETIDQIRTSMMNADYVLADVQNIIKGYLGYVSNQNSEEATGPDELMANQMTQDIDFDELEKKLKLFQSNFENDDDAAAPQELSD